MKKQIIALFLALCIVFTLVPVQTASAGSSSTATFTVTADKATANRGDTVNFTIAFSQTGKTNTLETTLVIPEGLTFVSGTVNSSAKSTLGFDDVAFTESSLYLNGYGATSFTGTSSVTLMTVVCTVDSDAAYGNYTVTLKDSVTSDDNYDVKTTTNNTSAATVTVVEEEEEGLSEPEITLSNAAVGITVDWTKSEGADGYYVFRKTSSTNWSTLAKLTSADILSYTDTTAVYGTTYYYTVRAYAGSTYSTFDTTKTITCGLPQPTVTLTNAATGVKISWTKSTGAEGYFVFRKTSSTNWSRIATITNVNTLTYTDTKASSGTTYYYTVRAYDGTVYSPFETTKSIRYFAQPTVTLTNASTGVKIDWTKSTGATGYYVFRKTSSTNWSRIATITSVNTLTYTDTGASSGTTYYYTVRAYNGTLYSSFVTNKTIKYLKEPAVSMVQYGSSVKVNWTPITGATGYYVFRKTSSTNWSRIATVTGQARGSYIDSTAVKGTKYWYTVRAYSGSTYSSFTTSKYITKTW